VDDYNGLLDAGAPNSIRKCDPRAHGYTVSVTVVASGALAGRAGGGCEAHRRARDGFPSSIDFLAQCVQDAVTRCPAAPRNSGFTLSSSSRHSS